MTKQAELLPAWMHPQNHQPPEYGDGERFRPNGEQWLDPADDNAIYVSNGYGYFEGCNGKSVREHPSHTLSLVIPEPHNVEYARYVSLDLHCWVVGRDELPTEWLRNELVGRGIQFNTCRIGLKNRKSAREEVISVHGLTAEIHEEIEAIIQEVLSRRQQQNAQWSKEQRLKFRQIDLQQIQEEQQMDMTEKRDLVKEWQGAFELARKHGISDDRVRYLWKQTASSDEAASLTDENMDMLYKLLQNEIEVKEAHENIAKETKETPTAESELANTTEQMPVEEVNKEEALKDPMPDTTEINGYTINKETGEIVDIDPDVVQELVGPVPQEMRQGNTFIIQDELSARWLIKRIRHRQREIEEAERELKELKNQVEVLKKRKLNEIKGIRFVYGNQLVEWAKSQLPIIKSGDKKGQFRGKSLVFTEGTLKFKETGGAKCIDKDKFESWWADLPESEKQMYPHKVTYAMLLSHVASCLNNGIEIPGFVNESTNPVGDWEITVSVPRKSKKGTKTSELTEEADEEIKEDIQETEHEAA